MLSVAICDHYNRAKAGEVCGHLCYNCCDCLDFRKSSLLMSSPIGQSPRQRTVLDSRAIGHASRSLHSGEGLSGLSRYHDESAEVLLGVMHFPFMWDYEALLG